jgi:hypothetical protein
MNKIEWRCEHPMECWIWTSYIKGMLFINDKYEKSIMFIDKEAQEYHKHLETTENTTNNIWYWMIMNTDLVVTLNPLSDIEAHKWFKSNGYSNVKFIY